MKVIFSLAFVFLVGCAANKPAKPDFRPDGKALEPREQVSRLGVYSSRSYPSKPLNPWWKMAVTSVDGVTIPAGTTVVQLTPGVHKVDYSCKYWFSDKDTGGASSNGSVSIDLKAGKTVWLYAAGTMTGYENFGVNGIKSMGFCKFESFMDRDPFLLP